MARVLVVYFSRTGHTGVVGKAIASAVGADLEEIAETKKRKGLMGYLRSAFESWSRIPVEIFAPSHDPKNYDLVILGTPVWAGAMSSPLRAYIVRHRELFKKVALYCTLGGAGAEGVLKDMAALCGKQSLATLSATEGEVRSGKYREHVMRFVEAVRGHLSSSQPAK